MGDTVISFRIVIKIHSRLHKVHHVRCSRACVTKKVIGSAAIHIHREIPKAKSISLDVVVLLY